MPPVRDPAAPPPVTARPGCVPLARVRPVRHPTSPGTLDPRWVTATVRTALDEDLGPAPGRDVTTQATVPADELGTAHLVARQAGVVAGLPVVQDVLDQVAQRLGLPAASVEHR